MYLYNVTYIVEDATANEWLGWVKQNHVPQIMASEKFVSERLLAVVDSPNEGKTFCTQFIAEQASDVKAFQLNFEKDIEVALQNQFPNKFVSFRSLMEFIS